MVIVRLEGYPFQHPFHVDFHEAGNQRPPDKGDLLQRSRDDHLFILALHVLDRNLRTFQSAVIKSVFINIRLEPGGRIDQAVAVHKGKFFQIKQRLHLPLESLQMLHVLQVVIVKHACRHIDGIDAVLQIGRHYLFPPVCQLVQVQQADGVRRLFRIFPGAPPCPQRPDNQYRNDDKDADQRRLPQAALFVAVLICHVPSPSCFVESIASGR